MKRAVVVIMVLAVVIGAGAGAYRYFLRPEEPTQPTYEVVTVSRSDIVKTVGTVGQVEPKRETGLAFAAAGKVTELAVTKGDTVVEGQVLARLDPSDLESNVLQAQQTLAAKEISLAKAEKATSYEDIETARAKLQSAEASYRELLAGPTEDDLIIAGADLKKAEAALKEAQANYDKVAWRGGSEAMSQSVALEQATIDYERALASYRQASEGAAESELKSAEAQVTEAQATLDELLDGPSVEDVELARIEVEQAQAALTDAEADLEGAVIVAPYEGVVTSVDVTPDEWVSAGSPVITVVDTSRVHVNVLVDEADVGDVREGQRAIVELDAFPKQELKGQLDLISPSASDESSVVAYEASIGFDPGDLDIRMGMTADVDIVTFEEIGALLIPDAAVMGDTEMGRYFVLKITEEGDRPVRTEIQVGSQSGAQTQVLSGLEEGDKVAVMSMTPHSGEMPQPPEGAERPRSMFMFGGGTPHD